MLDQDTIYAPSSGMGSAAISVIRLSGPAAHAVISELTGRDLPLPRQIAVRKIHDADGQVLDEAVVVVFDKGASFTGEAMAEIQCHGGRAVVGSILERIGEMPECRLAEPGEFTRRALLSGRIGLTEAEGLADLVAAETRLQQRQAMAVMSGGLGRMVENWRAELIRARALIEATIDWADEDVPEDVGPEVEGLLRGLVSDFSHELERGLKAEKLRNGIEVAIIGPPNAGKSSLLNAIAGRDAAIVSEQAGTTRDVIEVRVDLGGLLVVFLDTAGLRETSDGVEAEGVARAMRRAEAAEMRLHLNSVDTVPSDGGDLWQDGDIAVWSKSDLGQGEGDIAISVGDSGSVGRLLEMVQNRLGQRSYGEGLAGHQRQREALQQVLVVVEACLDGFADRAAEELAEDLRSAVSALDRLSGRLDVEDVLDVVFGSFCLGK